MSTQCKTYVVIRAVVTIGDIHPLQACSIAHPQAQENSRRRTALTGDFTTYLLRMVRETRPAEERLLQNDVPRAADNFEKLIKSSPNSSFIWIKYMAFLLSLNEFEKA
ncbi:rRNA biogenesis protein RRP5 [Tanacetum coccineum]